MTSGSTQDVVVFLGPSLPAADAARLLQASYLPPVAQGDVYRAALARPWGIAIIDGYFERVPAVWHKEILWALSRGIHVFGAASMGALRAAELAPFGMVGVGEIFEAYRTGAWLDDDEVTVVHADAEHGYRSLSVAMADMRATLARAEAAGVAPPALCAQLVQLAKALYYPERTYPRLWAQARAAGIADAAIGALRDWTGAHAVQQKRADAQQLLHHVAALREARAAAPAPSFHFEHTDAFEQLVRAEQARGQDAALSQHAVLDELRLEPDAFRAVAERALSRVLAGQAASRYELQVDEAAYAARVEAYRREHGLLDAAATQAFLAEQALSRDRLAELLRADVLAERVGSALRDDVERAMLDVLKLDGSYARLARAAGDKQARLDRQGATAGMSDEALVHWYLERVAQRSRRGADPQRLLASLQFRDPYQLLAAARREYLYEQTKGDDV